MLAEELELKGGDTFVCVLAITSKENCVDAIYTENISDFEGYGFLKVFNPLADSTQPRMGMK